MVDHPPRQAVARAVAAALEEDLLPLGDLTASLIEPSREGEAFLVARSPGVLAGTACVCETARQVGGIDLELQLEDGARLSEGSVIGRLSGRFRSLVTAERTILNFLCHLSGVATLTSRYVAAAGTVNPHVRICDTRKTTPGLRALEKAAVRAGGGTNHRGNLSEGVLVKDNHLGSVAVEEAVSAALRLYPGRMVEVECESREDVERAIAAGATMVMCDNMTPDELAVCVCLVRSSGRLIPVEASGGITLDTVTAFASAGPDLISVGALTHSAPSLDIALDLVTGISKHKA